MHSRKLAIAIWVAIASWAAQAAPQFRLRDTGGAVHTFEEWSGHPAIVFFFVATDCPVANSYVPEMNRIRGDYTARGVLFFAVQADTAVSDAAVAQYAEEYRYSFPVLLDPHQTLVRLADATIVPQAAVFTADGRRLYLGRIDNRVEDFGKERYQATAADLREALNAVLTGKQPPHPTTKSIGCGITRVPEATR